MHLSVLVLVSALILTTGCGQHPLGETIAETQSEYSHIRVRAAGSVRTLMFVDDTGTETRQSSLDTAAPGNLQVAYTGYQFASLLVRYPQDRVLMVGLGGGSMVRFFNHHFPEAHVDAVEIDPAVVALAAEHFGTRPGPNTRIFTEDAFAFLRRDHQPYDVIYMDAFLSPAEGTDEVGLPDQGKTRSFLKSLHRHLKPGGAVAFNLIESKSTKADLAAIRDAFPTVYVFDVPKYTNLAVIASLNPRFLSDETLRQTAQKLDRTHPLSFPLTALVPARVNK